MNDEYILPVINPADYDAFRRLPTRDLPDAYDEWLNLQAQRSLEYSRLGFRVIKVQVNLGEFTRYLARIGETANLKTLTDLALENPLAITSSSPRPAGRVVATIAALRAACAT